MTDGFSIPEKWEGANRLGPFTVKVGHENDKAKTAEAICNSIWPEPPDIRHSTALFQKSILLDRPGRYYVQILNQKSDVVAAIEVVSTNADYHPWMPFERGSSVALKEKQDSYDAAACVQNGANGIALPCFNGMDPLLFRSDGRGTDREIKRNAHERIPGLIPRVAGDGLTIKKIGSDILVESRNNIILARPDWHFLTRWWINGKPYIPRQADGIMYTNGMVVIGRKLLLHLDCDPQRMQAEHNARIELQLL